MRPSRPRAASVSRDRLDEEPLQRRNAALVGAASRARARRTGRDDRTRRGRARGRGVRGAVLRCSRVSSSSRSGRGMRLRVGEVMIELDARRHRRRAAVPRHDERAAGVGVAAALRRRSSPRTQPDRKPAENASPAPSTFSTSTVTPWPLNASSSERGIATVDHRAAHRAALDDERRRRHEAHRA